MPQIEDAIAVLPAGKALDGAGNPVAGVAGDFDAADGIPNNVGALRERYPELFKAMMIDGPMMQHLTKSESRRKRARKMLKDTYRD